VRDKAAAYLREAILTLAGGTEKALAIRGGKYAEVLGAWRVVKYFRGTLVGDAPRLAAEGQEYPIMVWSSRIKTFRRLESGHHSLTPEETLTARLAAGIAMNPKSFEAWGPKTGSGELPGPAD
jgi:hypothetical protein